MVTARYFEERMTDVVNESTTLTNSELMKNACELMMETLESLGYSVGVDILQNELKKRGA